MPALGRQFGPPACDDGPVRGLLGEDHQIPGGLSGANGSRVLEAQGAAIGVVALRRRDLREFLPAPGDARMA